MIKNLDNYKVYVYFFLYIYFTFFVLVYNTNYTPEQKKKRTNLVFFNKKYSVLLY